MALCVAALIAGCSKSENQTPTATSGGNNPAPAAKKLKLAFVSNNAANFWAFARAGCDAAAKELGDVDVDFRMTPTTAARPSSGRSWTTWWPRVLMASRSALTTRTTRQIF